MRIKWLKSEAGHLSASVAEVKKQWSYTARILGDV